MELWPNSIRESQLAGREFTRTSSTHATVTDASFHYQRCHPKKKSTRICTSYIHVDSWSLPHTSIMHAMHFQNHQNDTLRCIIFGIYGYGGPKAWHSVRAKIAPGTGQVLGSSGPFFAWIEEADPNPQTVCRYDPQEAQMAFGPYKGIIANQEIRKVGLSETHASGNREASTHNDWWKADWWNTCQQERSRRTWNDEVWDFFLKVFCTNTDRIQTTKWRIFCQDGHGVMNVNFCLDRVFPTFFLVSFTCSSDYSVYDGGCTYTHL